MVFYLILALIAIRAKKLLTVLLSIVGLQVVGAIVVAGSIYASIDAAGFMLSFLIKVTLGLSLFFYYKRKKLNVSYGEFKNDRLGLTIWLSCLIGLSLAWTIYSGVKEGQRHTEKARQNNVEQEGNDKNILRNEENLAKIIVRLMPDEGENQKATFKVINASPYPEWKIQVENTGNEANIVSSHQFYEYDFEEMARENGLSYQKMCSFHNGTSQEHIVYTLSYRGKKSLVAYVINEKIPFGFNSGMGTTWLKLAASSISKLDCEGLVKAKIKSDFKYMQREK